MNKEDKQLGYDFEDELKSIFKNLQSKYPFWWHQFIDTKAARNFVATQPSDFIVKSPVISTMFLEAKASVRKKSLASCAKAMILPAQIGHHKKYHRAGGDTLFIFYGELENKVELWNGKYVTDCISNSERMNILGGEHLLAVCDYFKLEEMLTNYFCKE